jgi:hypothetical protein
MESHIRPSTTRIGNRNTGTNSIEVNAYSTSNSFQDYLVDQIRYDKFG